MPAKPIGGADCVKPSEPNVKEVTRGGVCVCTSARYGRVPASRGAPSFSPMLKPGTSFCALTRKPGTYGRRKRLNIAGSPVDDTGWLCGQRRPFSGWHSWVLRLPRSEVSGGEWGIPHPKHAPVSRALFAPEHAPP